MLNFRIPRRCNYKLQQYLKPLWIDGECAVVQCASTTECELCPILPENLETARRRCQCLVRVIAAVTGHHRLNGADKWKP
jgi:hypothetical protein